MELSPWREPAPRPGRRLTAECRPLCVALGPAPHGGLLPPHAATGLPSPGRTFPAPRLGGLPLPRAHAVPQTVSISHRDLELREGPAHLEHSLLESKPGRPRGGPRSPGVNTLSQPAEQNPAPDRTCSVSGMVARRAAQPRSPPAPLPPPSTHGSRLPPRGSLGWRPQTC